MINTLAGWNQNTGSPVRSAVHDPGRSVPSHRSKIELFFNL